MSQKVVLHIGCGPDHIINTHGFEAENWREVRLDIDASFNPDIVSNMLDMKEVENGSVDAVFSSHNIEHLFAHEVPLACKEFLRVLRPEGYLILTCPDLQSVCAAVAQNKLNDPLYYTASGQPIAPIDIIFGHRAYIASGMHYMAHKCGFTAQTLMQSLLSAGFANAAVVSHKQSFALYAIATKQKQSNEVIKELFNHHWNSSHMTQNDAP